MKVLLSKVRGSLGYLWILAVAVYLAILSGQALLRNYQSQQGIDDLRGRLSELRVEKERQEALLTYYRSDAFKEKELRRTQLLALPNERVYALPESSHGQVARGDEALAPKNQAAAPLGEQPIWRQWVDYFF